MPFLTLVRSTSRSVIIIEADMRIRLLRHGLQPGTTVPLLYRFTCVISIVKDVSGGR